MADRGRRHHSDRTPCTLTTALPDTHFRPGSWRREGTARGQTDSRAQVPRPLRTGSQGSLGPLLPLGPEQEGPCRGAWPSWASRSRRGQAPPPAFHQGPFRSTVTGLQVTGHTTALFKPPGPQPGAPARPCGSPRGPGGLPPPTFPSHLETPVHPQPPPPGSTRAAPFPLQGHSRWLPP